MKQLNIGTEAAWKKITAFCTYQERTHEEVKKKLYSFGLYKNETEQLVSRLIEENYLNEERFAIAFAGGKFRINDWGKQKIKYALVQKKISAYCIKKALSSIDDADYENKLKSITKKKFASLKTEKNILVKRQKLYNYLLQKGFEANLVKESIERLISE